MKLFLAAVLGAIFLVKIDSAAATTERVYMGVTPLELAEVLKSAGWQPSKALRHDQRTISFKYKNNDQWSIDVTLRECGSDNRCKSGYLEASSYFVVPNTHPWYWNQMHHGAVAYSTANHRIKRPLYFHGVTSAYLKGVLLEVWPRAHAVFWKSGRKAHDKLFRQRRSGQTRK